MKEKDNLAPTRKPTFLREWRKYLKLSQETAADRMGIKQGTLSKIERRELPYNQDFLEKAAEAYGCDVDDLLGVNPLKPDTPRMIYSQVKKATPQKQREILSIVEALLKAS
jgi:transcriptional regulator with XRE-family HTH domain